MQVAPDTKGKSNMVYPDSNKKYLPREKWIVSVVIEQGHVISKIDYKMTAYDPRTFRAFFEPVRGTKPIRLHASPSKRQRPQIVSITLLEYDQDRIASEEQISLHPLSFSVSDPGTFCLFRDRTFWHMYVRVDMEDHSYEFNRRRDPQRWITPLGFEVEVDMSLSDKKDSDFVQGFAKAEESFDEKVKRNDSEKSDDDDDDDLASPPPMARSTSSFPFHNRTFTEWCMNRTPKWKRKLRKFAYNLRNAFNRTTMF